MRLRLRWYFAAISLLFRWYSYWAVIYVCYWVWVANLASASDPLCSRLSEGNLKAVERGT